MSNQIQPNKTELFRELSEQEQEATLGGLIALFGNYTKGVSTSASNVLEYTNADGDISLNSTSQSQYTSLQEFNFVLFDFSSYYYPGRRYSIPPMELIYRVIKSFY